MTEQTNQTEHQPDIDGMTDQELEALTNPEPAAVDAAPEPDRTKPIKLPSFAAVLITNARNSTPVVRKDRRTNRPTGVIAQAIAQVTIPLGHGLTFNRTIWKARQKAPDGSWITSYELSLRDQYRTLDYADEASAKAWSRWVAEFLSPNGPMDRWLASANNRPVFDDRPRLVRTETVDDAEAAAMSKMIADAHQAAVAALAK